MSAQMVDPDQRHPPGERQGFGGRDAERQAGGEARSPGHRDSIDSPTLPFGAGADQERRHVAEMLARRQIRDHPAMEFVDGDLAMEPFAGQAARGIEYRHRRFVAGSLERQNHSAASADPRPRQAGKSAGFAGAGVARRRADLVMARRRMGRLVVEHLDSFQDVAGRRQLPVLERRKTELRLDFLRIGQVGPAADLLARAGCPRPSSSRLRPARRDALAVNGDAALGV